ncbi:unnamed protein product [Nyctereutes procyonoides]|uniref:(raccoon dog) hypothetical protein n=1 Tax=Nyctereutes procyonoides TaxID=34880 RepID=A0A811Z5A0_NYCPR|nr:unnamed protein product [Nyctereutes procyonoides]
MHKFLYVQLLGREDSTTTQPYGIAPFPLLGYPTWLLPTTPGARALCRAALRHALPSPTGTSQHLRPRAPAAAKAPGSEGFSKSVRAPFATGSGSISSRGGRPAPASRARLAGGRPCLRLLPSSSHRRRGWTGPARAYPWRRRVGGLGPGAVACGAWTLGSCHAPRGGPQPAPLDAPLGGLRQGLKLRLMITANLGLPPKKRLIFPATTG